MSAATPHPESASTPTPGDRRLRVALWTWSRRDRRGSGDVVVDTARDLIDAGGSVNREAFGLAKTGLVLRLRGTARDVRLAPWQAAAPLLIVLAAVLWTGLTVADAGGWRRTFGDGAEQVIYTYGTETTGGLVGDLQFRLLFVGDQWIVSLSALLVAFALAGWRWLTVPIIAAIGAAVYGWIGSASNLGYVEVVFQQPSTSIANDIPAQTAITMYGVVGLLLAVAFTTALAWAITGTLQRRRRSADERAADRRPLHQSALIAIGAVSVTLALPRLALWITETAESILGTDDLSEMWATTGTQSVWLLFAAIVVVLAAALVVPRRRPSAGVALVLRAGALWIPTLWLFGGMFTVGIPFTWVGVPEGPAILLDWLVLGLGGVAVGAWLVARAGRAHAHQSGGSPTPAAPTGATPTPQSAR